MAEYDFSLVEAAIIDTQHNTLRLMRDVLVRLGIKNVATYANFRDAATAFKSATPDLVLVDADGPEAETEAFRLVRSLRNEPGTPNPFACLIVTTWQPTPVLLMRVTNAGADDLLVKPVSPKQVQERIVTLIKERRSFVVTSDYIGPDRRKSPRESNQILLLEVPNTLKLKATGKFGTTNVRQLMFQANRQVSEQKVLRSSVQAAFLIEFAREGLTAATPDRMAVEHLSRVPATVDELVRRLPDDRDTSAVRNAARALKQMVESLRAQLETGPADGAEVSRTVALSRDLMQAVNPERPLDSMIREVDGAVAGYRNRLEQLAQARNAPPPDPAPEAKAS